MIGREPDLFTNQRLIRLFFRASWLQWACKKDQILLDFRGIYIYFFFKYIFGLFAFNGQVSRDRQETGGRERGMTRRIRPLGAGFEQGSLAARTVASTQLCSTPISVEYLTTDEDRTIFIWLFIYTY